MSPLDSLRFTTHSVLAYPTRTTLMLLAMAIGVASVITLTSLGEGARRYVTGEFASLGTHLLIVLPGRSETTGGHPPLMGETPRDLTLDDALALERVRSIRRVAPVQLGSAPVSWREREREIVVIGTTRDFLEVRHLTLGQGRFLPPGDPRRATPVAVIGAKVRRELFGAESALGDWIRIGDRRFRVIGVLGSEGRSIGLDLQDIVIVPVAAAQQLFDQNSLFRILVEASTEEDVPRAQSAVRDIIRDRHDGEDDVTVIAQDSVVATFDKIFKALTFTVGGIAAISLAVAGILIMNVMLVAVSQRTAEIGLLKALGTPRRRIVWLFLLEAALLSAMGALLGLAIGVGAAWLVAELYPVLPLSVPIWAVGAALGIALGTGILFGVLPARRAAALDPVLALSQAR